MQDLSNKRIDNGIYAALCAFGAYIMFSIVIGWPFLIFLPMWLIVPFVAFGLGALLTTRYPGWAVTVGIICGLIGVGMGTYSILSKI